MTTEQTAQKLVEVDVSPAPLERLAALLPEDHAQRLSSDIERAHEVLDGRTVWNVNSTAAGGGVAEMLRPLIAYARGAGIDVRWLVIKGEPQFFALTKRLHNFLHGSEGDGGSLGADEHAVYEQLLRNHSDDLLARVKSGDIVILHDPQTAGLADVLREAGALVIWRCHIGSDSSNEHTAEGWDFLRQYVENASALVFTREQYAPEWVSRERLQVIPPSIDPFALKNVELDDAEVDAVLQLVGLAPERGRPQPVTFEDSTGSTQTVRRHGT
jgi:trehalose synthase